MWMGRVRDGCVCALLAVLIAAGVYGILLIRTVTAVVATVPAEIDGTRADLIREVRATRVDLTGQITALRRDAVGQVGALRSDVMARVDRIEVDANARVGDSLARVDTALAVADHRLGEVTATAAGLRADLKPTFDNSASLAKDLQDSLDDNYDDIKATINSSTVAVTGIARAAEAIGKAAPGITKSVDSVADSAAREADHLTKPQTFWQGLKSWLLVVSRCAGFLL
jgi:methyl-accepting chemotaxis protein